MYDVVLRTLVHAGDVTRIRRWCAQDESLIPRFAEFGNYTSLPSNSAGVAVFEGLTVTSSALRSVFVMFVCETIVLGDVQFMTVRTLEHSLLVGPTHALSSRPDGASCARHTHRRDPTRPQFCIERGGRPPFPVPACDPRCG